jgi:hypothetical protein
LFCTLSLLEIPRTSTTVISAAISTKIPYASTAKVSSIISSTKVSYAATTILATITAITLLFSCFTLASLFA